MDGPSDAFTGSARHPRSPAPDSSTLDPDPAGLLALNTELQARVELLSHSGRELQTLLGAIRIPTIILDRELRVQGFTPSSMELFNLIPTDTGRPLAELAHRLDFDAVAADAGAVLESLEPREREVLSTAGDWFLARAMPYQPREAQAAGVVVTFIDITERKRVEESLRVSRRRLSDIFSQAAVGLAEISFDGRFRQVNAELCRMFGREREALLGQPMPDFTHPDDLEATLAAFRRLVETGRTASLDKRYLLPDGEVVWANSTITRLDDETGSPQSVLAVVVDLTARKQVELRLRQSHEDLERRVRERTTELDQAILALRTEMQERQRAQAQRQELQRQLLSAQEDERAHISRELHDAVGQHVTALILGLKALAPAVREPADALALRGLLEIAETIGAEVHELALELRPTALDDIGLARTLANHAQKWSTLTGILVTFHCAGMEGPRLSRHIETTLYRIACEALNNVRKHSGARHVSLILERRDTQVMVIVEDDGHGFDPETKAKSANGGRGRLGLLGMRERTALLDGEFTVESSPGQGTTIFVRVPLVPPVGA